MISLVITKTSVTPLSRQAAQSRETTSASNYTPNTLHTMPIISKKFFAGLLLLASAAQVSAFHTTSRDQDFCCQKQIQGNDMDLVSITCPPQDGRSQSRRALFRNAASLIVSGTTFALLEGPSMANAASSVPTAAELERLRKGHARVQYMLANWLDITEVCKNNSDQANKQVVR